MRNQFLLLVTVVTLVSCGPTIYKSGKMNSAIATHKTVAILPASITMQLRPNEMKKMTADQIDDLTSKTGYDVQEQMHSWFLNRSVKRNYTVGFQDILKTNAILKEQGITYRDLASTDAVNLAKLLGVDAVITTRMTMDKPMSTGAAVAVAVLVGFYGTTNNVVTNLAIRDGQDGEVLWKYDYNAAGSVGSSTSNLVKALMRNASKKFPYTVN